MDEQRINPGHSGIRGLLRIVGPAIVLCGGLFTAIGLISFFSAFGTFEPPRYFWCAFIGLPMIFVGMLLTKVAFFGAIARYMAAEAAPVGKDTFNYMAGETKSGVRDITSAIRDGLAGTSRPCGRCETNNDARAKFCANCGDSLNASTTCSVCSAENDRDASFCDKCGAKIHADRTDSI